MAVGWLETTVFLGTALLCLFYYIRQSFKYWERKNVPFIKPSIPMGNFEPPWATKKGILGTVNSFYKEFKGKGYRYGGIYMSLQPFFVPIDLDLLKRIMMGDFSHFVDRGTYYNEKSDPLSAHLFAIDGDKWRSLRVRLSPTFTSGKMKGMFKLVADCSDGLEREVNKLWKQKEPADIKEICALFTINVIGTCAFGLDCNCFENPNNEFRHHTKVFFNIGSLKLLRFLSIQAFPNLCKKMGIRFNPKSVSDFFMKTIKDVIDHRESTKIKRHDFVDLLLDIKNGAKNGEESFTFNEIAAQAFVFFLAGFETSSTTMTFAFYEMARNHDVQDKVREEVRRVLAKHDGQLTYDAVMEMTYMSQVFDETLRKYPIVGFLQRKCTKDYKVPGSDLVLEKDTLLLIPLKSIQDDPDYYPDPEKFDPERFSPENKENRHPCAYMPFGEGPRNCIGMRFGLMQAKVGAAILLKDYKYSISPKSPELKLNPKMGILQPITQILLDIEKVH